MFLKDNVSECWARNHRSRDAVYHMCHVSKTPPFSKKKIYILQSLEGPQKHEVEYCGCGEVDRENQT